MLLSLGLGSPPDKLIYMLIGKGYQAYTLYHGVSHDSIIETACHCQQEVWPSRLRQQRLAL